MVGGCFLAKVNKYIKPDKYLSQWGINMKALEDFSGVSYRTLLNWYNGGRRDLFDIVVLGVMCIMNNITEQQLYNDMVKEA